MNISTLERHRQQFPGLRDKAYFNYGGQGPMPEAAIAAILQSYQQIQALGPFSNKAYAWVMEQMEALRREIATELGTSPESITLTENVSMGCNIALWGIHWQPGDHLLLTDCEHHSVIATGQEIQRRFGIEVSTCPLRATLNQGSPVEAIARHLKPNTRLVALSHILWNTGQVLPLGEIVAVCHRHPGRYPIRVLVDAAQSVGVMPLCLDELQADFYAFTGHKWWCGPEGLGGLYIRPEVRDELHPTFIGWRGITTDGTGYPTGWKLDGRRYEVATSAFPLLAGLRAAIALHSQWGTPQERYQRIQMLSHYLWEQLVNVPQVSCLRQFPPEAGLVSFQLMNKSHRQLVQWLENQNVMVRMILSPDCVRACVHYFTLESEIDQLVSWLRSLGAVVQ
jgi:L-cysteine/cystine lyase